MKNKLLIIFLLIFSLSIFLRLKNILSSPPSPYWEEVALAYDSFSIAETARDHHGNFLPLTAFESFGDWKPSLYFYVAVPFVKIFGLNLLAIRLPSILAGIFLTVATALFAQLLASKFLEKRNRSSFTLIAFFVATVSPWAITFSRAAWESNLNFFLLFIEKSKKKEKRQLLYLFSSVIFLVLSTYAYHSARFIAPLLGFIMFVIYLFELKKRSNWKQLFPVFLLAVLMIFPILKSMTNNVGQQRITETSIFSDISIIEKSNELKAAANNSFVSRIIYHRYLLFAKEISLNILDHFSFDYLFVSGDQNPRHSIQSFGLFYGFEIIFLLLGIIFLLKKWNIYFAFLLAYILISIFPAAITKTTPHALRTLAAMPAFIIIISLGIWQFLTVFKKENIRKLFSVFLLLVYLSQLFSFWKSLNQDYPYLYSNQWQYGYQKLMTYLGEVQKDYQKIYVTREEGRPAIYFWFYNQIDPRLVQATNDSAKKDQGEFLEFENIEFVNGSGEFTDNDALLVSSQKTYQELAQKEDLEILKEVKDLSGKIVWIVYARIEK